MRARRPHSRLECGGREGCQADGHRGLLLPRRVQPGSQQLGLNLPLVGLQLPLLRLPVLLRLQLLLHLALLQASRRQLLQCLLLQRL